MNQTTDDALRGACVSEPSIASDHDTFLQLAEVQLAEAECAWYAAPSPETAGGVATALRRVAVKWEAAARQRLAEEPTFCCRERSLRGLTIHVDRRQPVQSVPGRVFFGCRFRFGDRVVGGWLNLHDGELVEFVRSGATLRVAAEVPVPLPAVLAEAIRQAAEGGERR